MIHKWFHLGNILAFGLVAYFSTFSAKGQFYFLTVVCVFALIRSIVGVKKQLVKVTENEAYLFLASSIPPIVFLLLGASTWLDPLFMVELGKYFSLPYVSLVIIFLGLLQYMIYSGINEEPGVMDQVNFAVIHLISMILALTSLIGSGNELTLFIAILAVAIGAIASLFTMKSRSRLIKIRLLVGIAMISIVSTIAFMDSLQLLIKYVSVVTWSVFGLTIINLIDEFRRLR